jgi:hypothetical protein
MAGRVTLCKICRTRWIAPISTVIQYLLLFLLILLSLLVVTPAWLQRAEQGY